MEGPTQLSSVYDKEENLPREDVTRGRHHRLPEQPVAGRVLEEADAFDGHTVEANPCVESF